MPSCCSLRFFIWLEVQIIFLDMHYSLLPWIPPNPHARIAYRWRMTFSGLRMTWATLVQRSMRLLPPVPASIEHWLTERERYPSYVVCTTCWRRSPSLSLSFTLSLTLSLCSPPPCPSLISRSHPFPCSYIFFSLQLQFLFELPTRLKKCIEMGFYGQAVR